MGDGQKGDSKVFCRLRREDLIQSRFILFFYDQLLALVPPWLNIVHKYTCDIFDQSSILRLTILGGQKESNTRDTISSAYWHFQIVCTQYLLHNAHSSLLKTKLLNSTKSNPDSG